jgi:dGTPase
VCLAAERYHAGDADDVAAAAQRLARLDVWPSEFDGSMRALTALKRLTSELIARLTVAAVHATRGTYGNGPLARYAADLVVPTEARAECAVLKAVADWFVMRRTETVQAQERQREQLRALVDALSARAPESLEPWLRDAWTRAPDDCARLRVVVDQVASLTDTSAAAWFVRWCG